MSVILRSLFTKQTERNTKERRKVVKELVNELMNPSFDDLIKTFAATFIPDEKTKDLNERNQYKRGVSTQKQNVFYINYLPSVNILLGNESTCRSYHVPFLE